MSKIDEVKKILEEKRSAVRYEWTGNGHAPIYTCSNEDLAKQICQLFEPEPSEITALPLDALPDCHRLEGYSMTTTLSNENLLLSDEEEK